MKAKSRVRRYLPVSAAHHRAFAVVDLRLFTGRRNDDGTRLGRGIASKLPDESLDARIPRPEAVVVDQLLPNRHRVAALGERRFNQVDMRLAGTDGGRATARRHPFRAARVGEHLFGRF